MPSPKQLAVIAAAGSHKTEFIVNEALAAAGKRILLTTYTLHNLRCIVQRIYSKVGHIPEHITIMSWYGFLFSQWCRPYQRAVLGVPGLISGIDFQSTRPRLIRQSRPKAYYTNIAGCLYRDWVADFATKVNLATDGAAIQRLETICDQIYIDEVQDLVGYDLDVLDFLLRSEIQVVMVGDLRQHTYATNQNMKNRRYRGVGLSDWFAERTAICKVESRTVSYRCNQAICDFADALYPDLPATISGNLEVRSPSGILILKAGELPNHVAAYNPVVLRHSVSSNTLGFPAINFGASKGNTFDHVVIFPTGDIRKYLKAGDPSNLADATRSKLYVAVTRARHSAAFVV
jgi:DNA helicase II / ATP-dependent DNA helicase PcrA